MATAKTGGFVVGITTRVAVRGWEGDWVTVLAVYTAETGGGGGENFVVLAVTVVTAKKGGLLAKNVAKEGGRGGGDVKNDPSWPSLI